MGSRNNKELELFQKAFLEGLCGDEPELKQEYRSRNSTLVKAKVLHAEVPEYVEKGWHVTGLLKKRTLLSRAKKHQDQLEDDVWCLLYRMGYPTLNRRGFTLPYHRDDGTLDGKQIDVFARDSETVLIVECKSSKELNRRSLQKDLAETQSFRGHMARALNKYYGPDFHPKIVWVYVTRNIIWSEPDLGRAEAANIKIVTENELNYYKAYIDHIGPAGRYQVLAEFLAGQKIPELTDVKVPAVKGVLNNHTYYSFVTTPKDLLKISFVNHFSLNHPDGQPAYQRMVSKSRLKNIAEYINKGGYFPTNLLVNFTDECRFDLLPSKEGAPDNVKYGWLYLPNRYKSAWIIDGQHRLFGYSFADVAHLDDDIFVLAFQKMDSTTEANLFITINHEQKSVPKGILVALQSDLKWESEHAGERIGAIASLLVKRINDDNSSPFFKRFSLEGVPPNVSQSMTMPEVVKGLERSRLLGRQVSGAYMLGALCGQTDEKTVQRAAKFLNQYFENLRSASPTRWAAGRQGYVATNQGVRAHFMLITHIIQLAESNGEIDAINATIDQLITVCARYVQPVLEFIASAPDASLQEQFAGKYGEGGLREFYFNLLSIINNKHAGFGPEEYRTYMTLKNDERLKDAHTDVIELNTKMMDYVLNVLKRHYGTERTRSGDDAFWENGIESPQIKESAYRKQQQDQVGKRLERFAYLEVLDLMKIVRQTNNWLLFKSVFDIPLPGDKGKAHNIDWMEKFNELRRIPAHASSMRVYDADDYKFLDWIKREFYIRLDTELSKT